jgi:structure-specific recognition protein 1
MMLPKPDEIHHIVCIGLDPPLKQGQTHYSFIAMQFKLDEEMEIELNLTDEQLESYGGRLKKHYDGPCWEVFPDILAGLAGKKLTRPAANFKT